MGSRILTIQRRVRELGRIRTGDSEPYTTDGGQQRRRARRSATFILTSSFRDQLDLAAELWGGQVEPWQPQGIGPKIWRVVTETDTLPAILPPAEPDPLSQGYELWSRTDCVRRCDGQREEKTNGPCVCIAQYGEEWWTRTDLPKGSTCLATTRLNVFLPLADFGFWRLETHSYWAATEITGVVDMIRARIGPDPAVPITLGIEQRERVKDGKRLSYPVVTVGLRGTTTAAILAGIAPVLSIEGDSVKAIEAPVSAEVEASGIRPDVVVDSNDKEWLDAIATVTSLEELRALRKTVGDAGEYTEVVKAAFWARRAEFPTAPSSVTVQRQAMADPAVGASIPDVDVVWTQILTAAGHKGWNLPEVEKQFRDRMGKDPSDADAATMVIFRDELQAGEL